MLARIISDCGWANYNPDDWDIDADALMAEAEGHPKFYEYVCRIASVADSHRTTKRYIISSYVAEPAHRDYREIGIWFRAEHDRDYLGTVCRDILGMIDGYLHVVERRGSDNDYVINMRFLTTVAGFRDHPSQVILRQRHCEFCYNDGRRPSSYRVFNYGGEISYVAHPLRDLPPEEVRIRCLQLMSEFAPDFNGGLF